MKFSKQLAIAGISLGTLGAIALLQMGGDEVQSDIRPGAEGASTTKSRAGESVPPVRPRHQVAAEEPSVLKKGVTDPRAIPAGRPSASLISKKYPYVGSKYSAADTLPLVDVSGKLSEDVCLEAGLEAPQIQSLQKIYNEFQGRMEDLTISKLEVDDSRELADGETAYVIQPFEADALKEFDTLAGKFSEAIGEEKQQALLSKYSVGLLFSGMGQYTTRLQVRLSDLSVYPPGTIVPDGLRYEIEFGCVDSVSGRELCAGSGGMESFNQEFGRILTDERLASAEQK